MRAAGIGLLLLLPLAPVLAGAAPARAASAPPTPQQASDGRVWTRATVRSTFSQSHGQRLYVTLKLLPRAKLPFTTLTFRVRDRGLVAGLQPGASIAFVAERIEGENTLTAIRAIAPCERFQRCE